MEVSLLFDWKTGVVKCRYLNWISNKALGKMPKMVMQGRKKFRRKKTLPRDKIGFGKKRKRRAAQHSISVSNFPVDSTLCPVPAFQ